MRSTKHSLLAIFSSEPFAQDISFLTNQFNILFIHTYEINEDFINTTFSNHTIQSIYINKNFGTGHALKNALQVAKDNNYSDCFIFNADHLNSIKLENFNKLFSATSSNDFCFLSLFNSFNSQLKPTVLSILFLQPYFFHIKTEILKNIPYEYNSNENLFLTELVFQASELKVKTKIFKMNDIHSSVNFKFFFQNLLYLIRTKLHFALFNSGFLYDKKFELHKNDHYPVKNSPNSSHSQICKTIPRNSRVLDIGCGKGYVANMLITENNCTVDGIDILSPREQTFPFNKYFQVDLIKEPHLLKDILSKNQYDVILLADIIEHMILPESILDLIRQHHQNSPTPKVVASTGNVAFFIIRLMLFSGRFNYGARGILDYTHTHLFTKRTFRQIFEQSGFTVGNIKPIPMPFNIVFKNETISLFFEKINIILCKWFPGLFSYQFLLEAKPLPTTKHILQNSITHTEGLRIV